MNIVKTLIVSAAAMLMLACGVAAAQSQLDLSTGPPPPQREAQPFDAQSDDSRSVLEIPQLPPGFDGCWVALEEGAPDELEQLPGAPSIGGWARKRIEYCFRRTANGVEISYQAFQVDKENAARQGYVVSNDHTRCTLIASNRDTVLLHTVHFEDQSQRLLGFIPFERTVGSVSNAICRLDGDDLNCETRALLLGGRASMLGGREPEEWYRMAWRRTMHRESTQN